MSADGCAYCEENGLIWSDARQEWYCPACKHVAPLPEKGSSSSGSVFDSRTDM
jgi:hypothetical protein